MAKRYKPRRTRAQRVWRGALRAAVLLLLAAAFAIEALGGRYGIPTWGQLYKALGVPLETAEALTGSEVTVTVLDVGQGDAVLIAQNGAYCLIDAGTSAGSEALCAALDRLGVRRLGLLVLTHPHADHSGGMVQLLREYPVETLLLPPVAPGAETPWTLTLLTTVAENHGTKVLTAETGQTHAVGEGTLTVLQAGFADADPTGKTENTLENDTSLCLRYTAGDFAFLDTGDAETSAEEALAATYKGGLHCTLMMAGHHGSSSSNTAALLRAASPQRVAISCGAGNEYGHPHDAVLRRLQQFDIPYDRTDTSGTLTYRWQDGALTLETAGKEVAPAPAA